MDNGQSRIRPSLNVTKSLPVMVTEARKPVSNLSVSREIKCFGKELTIIWDMKEIFYMLYIWKHMSSDRLMPNLPDCKCNLLLLQSELQTQREHVLLQQAHLHQ